MSEIGDHRWEGMSNDQLADVIRKMRGGKGAGQLGDVVNMLKKAADGMQAIDDALRRQLGALGIAWNSKEAAQKAHSMNAKAAEYADLSTAKVTESGSSVDGYGDDYGRAKNGMPEPETLTPKFGTSQGGTAKSGFPTLIGHTPDYVRQARTANEARQRALDGMNGYTGASRAGLAGHQPLPAAQATSINGTPVSGGTSASSYHGSSSDGGSNTPPYPLPTPNYLGGQGNPPGPGAPERYSATGSFGEPPDTHDGQQQPTPGAPQHTRLFDTAAMAAGIAGTAGGIAGATGREEQVIRGERKGPAAKFPGEPRNGTTGGLPEETTGRPAKPGASLMRPPTGRAQRKADSDRVRKYPVESDEVFNDVDEVAPPVIGDHAAEQ